MKVSLRREYSFTLDEIKEKLDLKGSVVNVNQFMGNTTNSNSPDYQKVTNVRITSNEDVESD